MSAPKFHHYVPRFYLNRFINQNGALWVYDKANDRSFQIKPENVAGENKFYEVKELMEVGQDPLLLEYQLADLESEASKITECWLRQTQSSNKVEIPNINREIMSDFIAVQLLRTAEARTILTQFDKLFSEEKNPKSINHDVFLHSQLLWDEELVNEMSKKIFDCIWIFGKLTSEDMVFWASDHPVLVKSSDNKQWLLGPRVFDPGMYIVFPLSPQIILYCHDQEFWRDLKVLNNFVSPVVFDQEMVNHENSGQVGLSKRFIFSNKDDFDFARDFCRVQYHVKNISRNRFELPPEDIMNLFLDKDS